MGKGSKIGTVAKWDKQENGTTHENVFDKGDRTNGSFCNMCYYGYSECMISKQSAGV